MSSPEAAIDVPSLHFAAGLPGFADAHRFALVGWGDDEGPFSILVSIEEPNLEFLVVPPHEFFPDYAPEVDDDTAERLGLQSADDALLLAIVTVRDDPSDATVNLLAPIVVNHRNNEAAQVVLDDARLPLRAPLFGS